MYYITHNMIRLCMLIVTLGMLSGCYKYVYVPQWVCPNTPIPVKQALKTKNMSEQTNTEEILRAMSYDLVYLEGYSLQLIKLLEGYNTKAEEIKQRPNPNKE